MSARTRAQDIDWNKLAAELKYLQENAFKSQDTRNTSSKRSFQRNFNTVQKDPNIEPVESKYFDRIHFKYSAPSRLAPTKAQKNETRQDKPEIRINGSVPKL